MDRLAWLSLLQQHRAIAVIRSPSLEVGRQMARAVADGGIRLLEVTWNSDRPADLVEQLCADLPDCCIGAGTLLTPDAIKDAIASGAEFLFSPSFHADLVQLADYHGVPYSPGALTPTEIVSAWQAGAASVKVFPVQSVGGDRYIQSLQGPLANIPLIPTGGVNVANAKLLLAAGAIAVGLSGSLFPPTSIATGHWEHITQLAADLMDHLSEFVDRSERSL